jgi:hypothetical protein
MKFINRDQFPFTCKGFKTYRGHGGEPLRQATMIYFEEGKTEIFEDVCYDREEIEKIGGTP